VTSQILFLAFLLICSAFFSGAEAGLFALDSIQSRKLRDDRSLPGRWAQSLMARPGEILTTLLVGNNLANIAFTVVGTTIFLRLMGDVGVEWSIVVLSLLVLVFGEVTPKTLAVNFPLFAARLSSIPLRLTNVFLKPLTVAFLGVSNAVLRILRIQAELHHAPVKAGAHEVREVMREVDSEADITRQESRLVQRILEFSGTTAEEIMTPRIDMVCAPVDMEREELDRFVRASRHSRIPMYEEDVDHIQGFLPVKESLIDPGKEIRRLLRPVAFYPETTPINNIFYEIQRSGTGMVIVVNEFGETVGLITREDLVEEIVGEIYDEYEKAVPDIVPAGEKTFIVRGATSLETLNQDLKLELPLDESITLNGFLCEVEGRIPPEGSRIEYGKAVFDVLEVKRHRVVKVRLVLREEGVSEEAGRDEPR
jgi:putative hemolysin